MFVSQLVALDNFSESRFSVSSWSRISKDVALTPECRQYPDNVDRVVHPAMLAAFKGHPQTGKHGRKRPREDPLGCVIRFLDVDPLSQVVRNVQAGEAALFGQHRLQVPVAVGDQGEPAWARLVFDPSLKFCENWRKVGLVFDHVLRYSGLREKQILKQLLQIKNYNEANYHCLLKVICNSFSP